MTCKMWWQGWRKGDAEMWGDSGWHGKNGEGRLWMNDGRRPELEVLFPVFSHYIRTSQMAEVRPV